MKRIVLMALMMVGIIGTASAQRDDLYFVPKKKKVVEQADEPVVADEAVGEKTLSVTAMPAKLLEMDEDVYNRRGSYLTEQGDAVSEFAMSDEGFVLITEEGDTMWMDTDTLRLTRVDDGEGWVNGFDGSDSDYEYAMRIIRFRNPRYAIPVSSPLYWDVVYGGALWPSWSWNIYDDGMYAYVFPTSSNWHYWDYMVSYPFGWSAWCNPWSYHHGSHWGYHWSGYHYGHVWYDPWFNPYFYGYNPGWHHGPHYGHHPHFGGVGKPGWGGNGPAAFPNYRTSTGSTRRDPQPTAGGVSASRTGATSTASTRTGTTGRTSSVRVVTGRTGASSSRTSTSGSSRTGAGDEAVRRGTGSSSSVSRSSASGSSRSSSISRSSGSTSSYSRPSSTRSSSSSVSRSSSSSSSSYSSGSSGSSRSSSSSRSSYSSGSSYSGSSSYSSGSSSSHSSYSSGSSRSSSSSSSSRSGGSRR